jgi:hypothetical protein
MTEQSVIPPVERDKLTKELTPDKFLRFTSKGNHEIYRVNFHNSPAIMIEIARLRELSYRENDCGTGEPIDIDDFDVQPHSYTQLVVWDPVQQELIGGYRYAICADFINHLQDLSMTHYFKLSRRFIDHILPYSIELGRAWINPSYQSGAHERKSIFGLDNLWDGIGAVLAENYQIKYLYGKVTIPANYHPVGRALILWLLNHYFHDFLHLVSPIKPIGVPDVNGIAGISPHYNNFEKDYKMVSTFLRQQKVKIPPMISAYFGLASRITTFGVTYNKELNHAFETGMMMRVADIYRDKYDRYVALPKEHFHRVAVG